MALAQRAVPRQQKATTLRYVETHIVDHCNLNCRGCGHFSPVSPPSYRDPARFARDITRLAALFDRLERVHLLGGEPLLHPDVLEFARAARAAAPEAAVGLITNGLLLPKMPAAWWDEVRDLRVEVRLSAYPISLPLESLLDRARDRGVEMVVTKAKDRFFTIPLRQRNRTRSARSFEECHELFECPFLEDGLLYACPVIPLSRILTDRFGMHFSEDPDDSLDIHRDDMTAEKILAFLAKPAPWCGHCDMESLRWAPWARSRRVLGEWT